MIRGDARHGAGFCVALVAGWLVIAYGVLQLLEGRDGVTGAARVAAWVAGGHVAHDLLLAPLACAIGALVAAVAAPQLRAPVRAGLFASAVVVAFGYPALRGLGRKPNNPSVLPLDYGTAVLTVLAVVWAMVALWLTLAWVRGRRAAAGHSGGAPTPRNGVAESPT